jgi:catechol 2,3-dioxygenase-like lactoylglutathione lyase family enzyme
MHRSRVGVVLVDAPPGAYEATRGFWAGVVGSEPEGDDGAHGTYSHLGLLGAGVRLEAQRLESEDDTARVHLDVETDDVPAEVARLEGLGATVVEGRHDYVVLRDPAGLLFCVIPHWTDGFAEHAVVHP